MAPFRLGLQARIVTALLSAALLPLLLCVVGAWVVLGGLIEEKSRELQRRVLQAHATTIDLYLAERLRALQILARTHTVDQLRQPGRLRRVLEELNAAYDQAFVDLGVIAITGRHLAYVGPFDLLEKNYATTPWFRTVLSQGAFVSDVFKGFRGVPHFVIAVKRQEGMQTWILRATINNAQFEALIRPAGLGGSGDAYVINDQGLYQTPPRRGLVLTQSPIRSPVAHRGLQEREVERDGERMVEATVWINHGRWMLVVQQSEAEIRAPVTRAMVWGGLLVLLVVLLMIVTAVVATRHLTGRIARANEEREQMSRDLLRSAKLASLGEMATGLAHEINNPLAIISAEQTNIGDAAGELPAESPSREEIIDAVERCHRQVSRCSAITSKMLQFGRHSQSKAKPTDVAPLLREIASLMEKQAAIRNVAIELQIDAGLPLVMLDPTELEQVVVNLVNNALAAIEHGGKIVITAYRQENELLMRVRDTGCGMAPAELEQIFQPFYTTKPVGRGTGLGLSVCYGIVRAWGGAIEVESELGLGSVFTVRLPLPTATAKPVPDSPIRREIRA